MKWMAVRRRRVKKTGRCVLALWEEEDEGEEGEREPIVGEL